MRACSEAGPPAGEAWHVLKHDGPVDRLPRRCMACDAGVLGVHRRGSNAPQHMSRIQAAQQVQVLEAKEKSTPFGVTSGGYGRSALQALLQLASGCHCFVQQPANACNLVYA